MEIRKKKRIALVAHDNQKINLLEWAEYNKLLLAEHKLYATGTTGKLLEDRLGLKINKLKSGPLGGDAELSSKVANGEIDLLIFFNDGLQAHSHDVDIKALLRIATVWNVPIACNRATADFIISSPLMKSIYTRIIPDYTGYIERFNE